MLEKRVVLSIDFELFIKHGFSHWSPGTILKVPTTESNAIKKLLGIFKLNKICSTFFTVADVCEIYPELLDKIVNEGHEIASHSLTHRPFSSLSDIDLVQEITDSKRNLEKTIGEKVAGFRSPAFAINDKIIRMIGKAGYEYDSSVVPGRTILGRGIPDASIYPSEVRDIFNVESNIIEFPLATNSMLRLPISGAWMRLFGVRYTILGIKSLLRKGAIPILYAHPWEFIDLPKVKGIPWRVYYRTGDTMFKMFNHIIKNVDAKFISLRELLDGDYNNSKHGV